MTRLTLLTLMGLIGTALAQRPPVVLPERFEIRVGPGAILGVAAPPARPRDENGRPLDAPYRLHLQLETNVSRNAFGVEFGDGEVEDSVGTRYTYSLSASLRLSNETIVGLGVPFLVQQRAKLDSRVGQLNGDAIGGVWLAAMRVWRPSDGWFIGPTARLTMPTDHEDILLGTGAVQLLTEVVGGYGFDTITVAVNLGYRSILGGLFGRPESSAGDELTYRVGARFAVAERHLLIDAALVGAVSPDQEDIDSRYGVAQAPLEWLGGMRWPIDANWTLFGSAGIGLSGGQGTPLARGILGIDLHFEPGGPGLRDPDGDDADRDDCPNDPEDVDGFEDADGCPDPDNDGDGVPDVKDMCPDAKEDRDGFLDGDGCPDLDNDNDGVPDTADKCPVSDSPRMKDLRARFGRYLYHQAGIDLIGPGKSAEDVDGFEDEDGCPDVDHDGDGVPEWVDQCNDLNGRGSRSGCPSDDQDGDGVIDSSDRCRDQRETVNAFVDEDGCAEVYRLPPLNGQSARVDGAAWMMVDRAGRVNARPPLFPAVSDQNKALGAFFNELLKQLEPASPIRLQVQTSAAGAPFVPLFEAAVDHPESRARLRLFCGVQQPEAVRIWMCVEGGPAAPVGGLPDQLEACTQPRGSARCPICDMAVDEDCDGVLKDDRCPNDAGPAVNQGCPGDIDQDGIPDAQDQCGTDPETVNGIMDTDGCPEPEVLRPQLFTQLLSVDDKGWIQPIADDPKAVLGGVKHLLEAFRPAGAPTGLTLLLTAGAADRDKARELFTRVRQAGVPESWIRTQCLAVLPSQDVLRLRLCVDGVSRVPAVDANVSACPPPDPETDCRREPTQ